MAQASARTGHLVGDRFTHADLAAGFASTPMEGPGTRPPASQALVDAPAGHPGIVWVEKIYAEHRPPIRDFEGPLPTTTS